jgi:hypothetical protein
VGAAVAVSAAVAELVPAVDFEAVVASVVAVVVSKPVEDFDA